MPRRIESLFIDGPAGRLEALLEEPEDRDPRHAVLVCHPHPQHGGTMHNKVVYRIARALRRAGAVVLRFNYRGVNLSEGEYDKGVGEVEDARAALGMLAIPLSRSSVFPGWFFVRLANHSETGLPDPGGLSANRRGLSGEFTGQPVARAMPDSKGLYREQKRSILCRIVHGGVLRRAGRTQRIDLGGRSRPLLRWFTGSI